MDWRAGGGLFSYEGLLYLNLFCPVNVVHKGKQKPPQSLVE